MRQKEVITLKHKDMRARILFASSYMSKRNIIKDIINSQENNEGTIIINYDELFSLSIFRQANYKHFSINDILIKESSEIKKVVLESSISSKDEDKMVVFDVPNLDPIKFDYVNNLIFINLLDVLLETNLKDKPYVIINGLLEHVFNNSPWELNKFLYTLSSQTRALGVPIVFLEKIGLAEVINKSENREDTKAIMANIYIKKDADRIEILNIY
jgi:hypothetical protein